MTHFPASARIVPAPSTSARQPGGSTKVASGSSKIAGPPCTRPAERLAAQHRGLDPVAVETHVADALFEVAPRLLPPAADAARARPSPGGCGRGRPRPLGRGGRSAPRGPRRSARRGRLGRDSSPAGDRQLEGLAGIAHLVDDLGPGFRRDRPRALPTSSSTSAAMRSALRSAPLSITVRVGVAATVRGAEAERREDAARARAEDALDAELGCDRRGVHRPGAAEGKQGEAARVDAALDA